MCPFPPYLPACLPASAMAPKRKPNLRVFINEAARVVDLIVNHHIKVLLCRMAGHFRVGEFFFGHGDGFGRAWRFIVGVRLRRD